MKIDSIFYKKILNNKYLLAFLVSLFTLIIFYRIQLTVSLFTSPVRPFDFYPNSNPIRFILAYLPYDLFLLLFCFIIIFLLSRIKFLLWKLIDSKILNILGGIFLNIFFVILLLIHGAHIRLLFNAQIGFDYSIFLETIVNVSMNEIIKFMDLSDFIYIILFLIIFWVIIFSSTGFKIWLLRGLLIIIIILSITSLFYFFDENEKTPSEIKYNPTLYFLSDLARNELLNLKKGERKIVTLKKEEEGGIKPVSPLFQDQKHQLKILPPKVNHSWNIIIFIMESVGTRYMFDNSLENPIPMPFLNRLTKEGWYLKRHFTTSNISTKAIFSILSGLYDLFDKEAFGIRADAYVPSIFNFIGKNYESFLVTPSPIRWYFPVEFVKNSGLKEIHHFDNLPFRIKEELHPFGRYIGRDETETVDFFLKRIEKAKEPFLGIYISFAAHLPYFDYGPKYRIIENDGHLIKRYYNNLYLLDNMIRLIYERLEKSGLLERTILVILGDHGQAFGQHHEDNYMHHRYSYNENLETPAIFYQPKLFKPRSLEFPTSHIDILPTLLDAVGIPFDPLLLNGESLFNNPLRRKFIFFYGQEGTISCLDSNLIKVQYSIKNSKCWAFDLKNDPDEKNPLDCSLFKSQIEALHFFTNHHNSSLIQYSLSNYKNIGFNTSKQPAYFKQ